MRLKKKMREKKCNLAIISIIHQLKKEKKIPD